MQQALVIVIFHPFCIFAILFFLFVFLEPNLRAFFCEDQEDFIASSEALKINLPT